MSFVTDKRYEPWPSTAVDRDYDWDDAGGLLEGDVTEEGEVNDGEDANSEDEREGGGEEEEGEEEEG